MSVPAGILAPKQEEHVMKRYVVELMDEEREQLHSLCGGGVVGARKLRRAHTLLLADEGEKDEAIARALHVGISTVERTRQRYVTEGLEAALNERPRPGGEPKLNGHQQAYLVALACSNPPEGRKVWTMQLLAEKLVEMKVVDSICDETVRRVLKRGM